MDCHLDPLKTIRFRSRVIQARAIPIYSNRPVFRLELPATPILDWLSLWISEPIHRLLKRVFPEWFLPSTIILKEKHPDKSEANGYSNEMEMYRRLEPLQGKYVPRCFGEAISDNGVTALVLECIEGTPLHQLPLEDLIDDAVLPALRQGTPREEFALEKLPDHRLLSALREMYEQLSKHGVVHGDPELHNFIRVGGGVMAIDFDLSHLLPNDLTNEHALQTLIDNVAYTIYEVIQPREEYPVESYIPPNMMSMADWFRCHRVGDD